MDADDISLPERFEEQVRFLEKENIDICGTFIQLFNENKDLFILKYPLNDSEIKFLLIFCCPLAHPTVMIRKVVFETFKYENFLHAEDYKLWTDIALSNFKMANIDKVLLKYRIHNEQICTKHQKSQRKTSYEISDNYIQNSQYKNNHVLLKLKELRTNANFTNSKKLFQELMLLCEKENIKGDTASNIMRGIFNTLSPMSPLIGFSYLIGTFKMEKTFKHKMAVLIQSFLFLDSYLYSILHSWLVNTKK